MLKDLSLTEVFLYGLLAAKADSKTGFFKNASRGLLSTYTLGKNTKKSKETITGYLQTLAHKELIANEHNWSSASDIFVNVPKSNYLELYDNLFFSESLKSCSAKAKGLFIKLAELAYKDSGKITADWKTIINKVGVSKNTYYKLIKELEAYDLYEDGQLNTSFFKVADSKKKSKVQQIRDIINIYEEEFEKLNKKNSYYRQYQYILSKVDSSKSEFEVLKFKKINYDKIFAGLFGKRLVLKRPVRVRL